MHCFKKVVVAVSGGVDSAVTAILLKLKGFHVEGVFMKNWDDVDEYGYCSSAEDLKDAQYVCNHLNIKLNQVNFVKQYWMDVFSKVINDYEEGYTPNPDILCNRHIKFNLLHQHVLKNLSADALATGHYAKSSFGDYLEYFDEHKNVKLLKPIDDFKDQTFFLSQVPQSALRKTLFPLGSYIKEEVKEIACKHGLNKIVKKKESTGMCFIGKRNFQQFISNYIPTKPGKLIDIDSGKIVGSHNGIHMWTLGQNCPLGGCPKPYYVIKKDVKNNVMYLAQGTDHPSLFSQIFYTDEPYFIDSKNNLRIGESMKCEFRFQHTKPLVSCLLFKMNSGGLLVHLSLPVKALTPGQYAVFYKQNECIGSGRIAQIGPSYHTLGWTVPVKRDYENHPKSYERKHMLIS